MTVKEALKHLKFVLVYNTDSDEEREAVRMAMDVLKEREESENE